MARTAFNIDPVQAGKVAQNSPDDAHFNKGLSYHLVSEFGQNTVDAFRLLMTSGTAHLRITRKLVDRAALVEFDIETVERHAKACEGEMGDFTVSDKVEMLLVEDASGGLDGHVTATDNDTKSALGRYLFEKGTGIHGKDGRSGGRFGLGSTVGTFISEVRAMYVHSMRRGGSTVASARLSAYAYARRPRILGGCPPWTHWRRWRMAGYPLRRSRGSTSSCMRDEPP